MRTNGSIRASEVRVISETGEQLGIMNIDAALAAAANAGLDLVEVSADAAPPVCRIMNHSKHLYEESQKEKAARRNTSKNVVKEIKFRPGIDTHDYETKRKQIEKFIAAGEKVRVSVMFRGREQSRPEIGLALLDKIAAELASMASVDSAPLREGRNMSMMLVSNADASRKNTKAKSAAPKQSESE